MFTQERIGEAISNLVWGIILGAVVVGWVLPLFHVLIPIWIGAAAGGVLGLLYGLAPTGGSNSGGNSTS